MTDDQSRIARLEERMSSVEDWIMLHQKIGEDVSMVKQCISTYNGSIKKIQDTVEVMHTTLSEWIGGLKLMRWLVGSVGLLVIVNMIMGVLDR